MVVSLDFELYWGVKDIRALESYKPDVRAIRLGIPALLKLFAEYDVHATWATVGMLFCESKDELLAAAPAERPQYAHSEMSPYDTVDGLGPGERSDPSCYGRSLIQSILATPHQEVGTHTFCHFYCLEDGQNLAAFRADLNAALRAAKPLNVNLDSIVFPRNQVNPAYLQACAEAGIKTYRGNNAGWMYAPRKREQETSFRRAMRLIDCYLSLSGHNTYSPSEIQQQIPMNVPSSRYLRMFSKVLSPLDPLRVHRIRREMSYAARHGRIYHLWLHPEDVGVNLDRNMDFFRRLFDHYSALRDRHGMESLTMNEVCQRFANGSPRSFKSRAMGSYAGN